MIVSSIAARHRDVHGLFSIMVEADGVADSRLRRRLHRHKYRHQRVLSEAPALDSFLMAYGRVHQ